MELRIEHLMKRYGEKVALADFSYTFTPGIYGILGANGAGKSTLMNLITDNVSRDGGSILFDGTEILKLGKAFRRLTTSSSCSIWARACLAGICLISAIYRKNARAEKSSYMSCCWCM